MPKDDSYYLKSIDKTLKDILKELQLHRRKSPDDLTATIKLDGKEVAKQIYNPSV
ncbi:hypothetical protein HRF87_00825 [Bacillus sp. CRN 9]|nr:hypothetical protein [Bacillus sp. CRN 9]